VRRSDQGQRRVSVTVVAASILNFDCGLDSVGTLNNRCYNIKPAKTLTQSETKMYEKNKKPFQSSQASHCEQYLERNKLLRLSDWGKNISWKTINSGSVLSQFYLRVLTTFGKRNPRKGTHSNFLSIRRKDPIPAKKMH